MAVNVSIRIETVIQYIHGEKEHLVQDIDGMLYSKENEHYLRYKEDQQMGDTTSIIKWAKQNPYEVSILRQGEYRMKQVFQKGQTYKGLYHSPAGTMEMESFTYQLHIDMLNQTDGKLYVEYELIMNQDKVGTYQLQIDFAHIGGMTS